MLVATKPDISTHRRDFLQMLEATNLDGFGWTLGHSHFQVATKPAILCGGVWTFSSCASSKNKYILDRTTGNKTRYF